MQVHVSGGYTCEFGMNAMRANLGGGDVSSVYSPTTGQYYAMYCQNLGGGGGGQRATCQIQGETNQNKLVWATP